MSLQLSIVMQRLLKVFLNTAFLQKHAKAWMIQDAVQAAGFVSFGCSRPSDKFEGKSLGDSFKGPVVHVNVAIPPKPFTNQTFPKYLLLNVKGLFDNTPITYGIAEHPDVSGIVCLKDAPCHQRIDSCLCKQFADSQADKTPRKRERPEDTLSDLLASRGIVKSQMPCRYLANGMCSSQEKCEFLHDPKLDPSAIWCRLEKKGRHKCRGKGVCFYRHPGDADVTPQKLKKTKASEIADVQMDGADLR